MQWSCGSKYGTLLFHTVGFMAPLWCLFPRPISVINCARPNAEAALVRWSHAILGGSSLASSHLELQVVRRCSRSRTCCTGENPTRMNITCMPFIAPCGVVKVPPRGTGTRLCHRHPSSVLTMRRARCQMTKTLFLVRDDVL